LRPRGFVANAEDDLNGEIRVGVAKAPDDSAGDRALPKDSYGDRAVIRLYHFRAIQFA
jgi:hypothetical protein